MLVLRVVEKGEDEENDERDEKGNENSDEEIAVIEDTAFLESHE